MKIETHPRDDHQITMIIELEQEKLEGARRRAAHSCSLARRHGSQQRRNQMTAQDALEGAGRGYKQLGSIGRPALKLGGNN